MMYKVIVNGAKGKMGQTTCHTIAQLDNYELSAELDVNDDLKASIEDTKADIVIDFTSAQCVYDNANTIIDSGAKAIIGTSGLDAEQISHLSEKCKAKSLGAIVVPNFSVGAILMMHFAELASRHFTEAEIIETHHQGKLDAPSGTAVKTAQMMDKARTQKRNDLPLKKVIEGARGATVDNVNVHSLRLPGYIASQQVIFGGEGENLSISHNSINRDCFMPGLRLALNQVMQLNELVYGLENFIISSQSS